MVRWKYENTYKKCLASILIQKPNYKMPMFLIAVILQDNNITDDQKKIISSYNAIS